MSTYSGKKLKIDIFGGSHESFIGAKICGLPQFDIDESELQMFLERRKPKSGLSTARAENDVPGIERAAQNEIVITIENSNVKKGDYSALYAEPRPSHADYAAYLKDGTLDFSGGGRFSGRMTAAVCAVGGLCLQALKKYGVKIAAYLYGAGGVYGESYRDKNLSVTEIEEKRGKIIPSISAQGQIEKAISAAKKGGDSVGGTVDCVVEGVPTGLGDNLFDGIESKLSYLLFGIPGVKAVEFGAGAALSKMRGSEANDQLYFDGEKVRFYSNNAGGINGGITNGNAITLSVTFRPTPSIAKEQKTIDLANNTNCVISVAGRHDACIALRGAPVVESMAAIGLLDEILSTER